MHEPPTAKQLALLARLKYSGSPPETEFEASKCIKELKEQKKLQKMSPAERKAYQNEKQKQAAQEQREWLRDRRTEIREQVREDLRDDRQNERELEKLGDRDPRWRLAGWLLRIGADCTEVRHLDGLLVTVADARADPGLMPPYDSCREETCVCEIEAVSARDVPKGTRIAERVGSPASVGEARAKRGSKLGWLLLLAIVALLIYLAVR
jgi:hypothetical protein